MYLKSGEKMVDRKELANAIRFLSIDAIERAKSGHPGAPMGMADIAEVLWNDFLKHNPKDPEWVNRDRFVLSNGHASMLLYSILHLSGYPITIEDIKNFRRLGSNTPGHPENFCTSGIETTTGPLGQGLAAAVGMALAEKMSSSFFNKKDCNIIDHYTWVFVGDGCLMEGISHEVCSLAGTLKLGKLIVLYDKNNISIDGNTKNWFTDNTAMRFRSYGWNVIESVNGHNYQKIFKAIKEAQDCVKRPSLIIFDTKIGFGSVNKVGTASVHGSPLGEKEVLLTRKNLNWKHSSFFIPDYIYKKWNANKKGKILQNDWNKKFVFYKKKYPELAEEFSRRKKLHFPEKWNIKIREMINNFQKKSGNLSTRQASQNVLEEVSKFLPELIGGSADLTPSNLTFHSRSKSINLHKSGNYIHYGVREFGMTAIGNGIANYKGFIPYTSTFLMFVEYAKNAVRMAALMKIRHIFIYTHDSIGLGEDGPTHQPIEQIVSLRITPNLEVWRPSDQVETAVAWKSALERKTGPTALVLSRQDLPYLKRSLSQVSLIKKGAYILKECKKKIDVIIISTGSELHIAFCIYKLLKNIGIFARIVAMPCTNVFDKQSDSYKEKILPKSIVKRVAIEAGTSSFWCKYVGLDGLIIGIDKFGSSAPAVDLFKKFGFSKKIIIEKIVNFLKY